MLSINGYLWIPFTKKLQKEKIEWWFSFSVSVKIDEVSGPFLSAIRAFSSYFSFDQSCQKHLFFDAFSFIFFNTILRFLDFASFFFHFWWILCTFLFDQFLCFSSNCYLFSRSILVRFWPFFQVNFRQGLSYSLINICLLTKTVTR